MLRTLLVMDIESKFEPNDIFINSAINGDAIIENIKYYILNLDNKQKLIYLQDVQDYMQNKLTHPLKISKDSELYSDYSHEGIELKKIYSARNVAFNQVKNWLDENINGGKLLKKKTIFFSLNIDDNYLPKLNLLHQKLIELKCIDENTKIKDFYLCFLHLKVEQITPIIWKETLPFLTKLIIKFQEIGIIWDYSSTQLNLCFDNHYRDEKYNRKLSKAINKIKNKTENSIDIKQEEKLIEILELFI